MMKYATSIAALVGAALASSSLSAQSTNVYSISNKADGNTIVAYDRGEDGTFSAPVEYPTRGIGTGDLEIPALEKNDDHPLANGDDPLISANALISVMDGRYLAAVNPGDQSVSLMRVAEDGSLAFSGRAQSSDRFPISLASSGNLIAVASVGNSNGEGSIGLLRITDDGQLEVVENSRRDLAARPSTISFAQGGKFLVVNELVTGKVNVFEFSRGALSADKVAVINSPRDSAGRFHAIPVGFAIREEEGRSTILMSEARFLTPEFGLRTLEQGGRFVVQSPLYTWQTGSTSSYHLEADGSIELVSGDVLTGASIEGGQIANCWVALSPDGKTLWAVNALSSSISTYRVRENGTLNLVDETSFKDNSEQMFLSDIAVSDDGSEIYQLVGNRGMVLVMGVNDDGSIEVRQSLSGLPKLGAYGIVALNIEN